MIFDELAEVTEAEIVLKTIQKRFKLEEILEILNLKLLN
jgi:hypothetical protein